MTILDESSLDIRFENAKQFVNKIQEAEELIKARKYKSALTFLQASKPYCTTAKSHLGNSLYFKTLADIYLGIQQKEQCEKACDCVYHNLVKARQKLEERKGLKLGENDDDIIEFFFNHFVKHPINLYTEIVPYYLSLEKPQKALSAIEQLHIKFQGSQEFSDISYNYVKISEFQSLIYTAWAYNQLGHYMKGLELLKNIINNTLDLELAVTALLKIMLAYAEAQSNSTLQEEIREDNQEKIFIEIKELHQIFVKSTNKTNFKIFLDRFEKGTFFWNTKFPNLKNAMRTHEINKLYIPPFVVITFWQVGVSLLNLGKENEGRQLINSLKNVLSENKDKLFLEANFDAILISLIEN